MKRWLINIAAGLSAILCIVTVVLWVRSFRQVDKISHFSDSQTRTRHVRLLSVRGLLELSTFEYAAVPASERVRGFVHSSGSRVKYALLRDQADEIARFDNVSSGTWRLH